MPLLGKYPQHHIPHCHSGFWESFKFTPEMPATPSSTKRLARGGRLHVTTATLPKARAYSSLNGAEMVYNPSATVAGLSNIFGKSSSAHAVANAYLSPPSIAVGTRSSWEKWRILRLKDTFCDPRAKIVKHASRDRDEAVAS